MLQGGGERRRLVFVGFCGLGGFLFHYLLMFIGRLYLETSDRDPHVMESRPK